ncbi:LCP family protein [Streptosporangiaceae bacterium NEAU-GS5]|nr:LCP family protein [Streptosporangiaceae bacterium NEAU-GS5]
MPAGRFNVLVVTSRNRSATEIVAWTALSAVAPGAAHLRAGWRRTGFALLGCYCLILAGAAGVVVQADAELAGEALNWLNAIGNTAAAAGLGWFCLVVHSYVVLEPRRLSKAGQIVTGAVAAILAVVVATPFALAAHYARVSQEMLDSVFSAPAPPQPSVSATPDPWGGRDRVNVLLLGGDWDDDRIGVRTDSINVASVDVATGDTVLLGLPRNLEHVRFPPGTPMAQRFPYGFALPEYRPGWREDLLFSVWQYADEHPELFGGRRHMGAQVLKETVGYILGLKIDWYTLVNIWGFAKIIDAIGGLVLTVDQDVVFGKYNEGLVRAGTRRLDGDQALWFARSRTYSDDYTRMRRQRCVFSALLSQTDPATVLTRFTSIAQATKNIIHTDIPRPMLAHLVPLALKAKHAQVTSLQFTPPLINTAAPDWAKIRQLTAKALRAPAESAVRPGIPLTSSPIADGCGDAAVMP